MERVTIYIVLVDYEPGILSVSVSMKYFSHWFELFILPNHAAASVASTLNENVVSQFGLSLQQY